jgi:hypothetical protein
MDVKEENYRKRMYLGQDGNALIQLLVLNAVIFVVLKFVSVFFLATGNSGPSFITHVFNWFTLSANPEKIVWRPWTLISFVLFPTCSGYGVLAIFCRISRETVN